MPTWAFWWRCWWGSSASTCSHARRSPSRNRPDAPRPTSATAFLWAVGLDPRTRQSFRGQRIFLIASSVTTHSAKRCQHREQRVLDSDRRTRGPDEIAHLLQQHGPLQQVDVAFRREFAVAAEPELGLKEDLGRLQRRPVLVVDAQDAIACVPLAVRDADGTDERVSGLRDSRPIPDQVSVRPFQDHETLLLAGMDMSPDDVWAWLHDQLRSEELPV